MTRARATALALVNWKGVFFERYALDRHVTALEGQNGAGKTTVMIAAYVSTILRVGSHRRPLMRRGPCSRRSRCPS